MDPERYVIQVDTEPTYSEHGVGHTIKLSIRCADCHAAIPRYGNPWFITAIELDRSIAQHDAWHLAHPEGSAPPTGGPFDPGFGKSATDRLRRRRLGRLVQAWTSRPCRQVA